MSCSKQYQTLCDEQLVALVREGDTQAFVVLLNRYQKALRKKAQSFSKTYSECDDYHQEALISFYKAVQTFKGEKASFRTYFMTCVTNALISLKRTLNKADEQFNEEKSEVLQNDPLSLLESQETLDDLNKMMNTLLSDFERQALDLYLGGNSYEQIAKRLNSTPKSVDNALQRVRRKLKTFG